MQRAARALSIEALCLDVRNAADVGRAFETAIREQVGAIVLSVDGVARANQRQIIELAARHKLPAVAISPMLCQKASTHPYLSWNPSTYQHKLGSRSNS